MAKVGRPPVEDKKYIKVGFRVTEAERDRLFAYCKKMNLTKHRSLRKRLSSFTRPNPKKAVPLQKGGKQIGTEQEGLPRLCAQKR